MDTSAYKEALLRKRGEIFSSGGGVVKPLQASMDVNSRQGDLADQASGNNEVHIQLKLKQTDAKILQAIEEARWRIDAITDVGGSVDNVAEPSLNPSGKGEQVQTSILREDSQGAQAFADR